MMPGFREILIDKTSSKSSPNAKLSRQARHFKERKNSTSETSFRLWHYRRNRISGFFFIDKSELEQNIENRGVRKPVKKRGETEKPNE